jgi:hypothetical protein
MAQSAHCGGLYSYTEGILFCIFHCTSTNLSPICGFPFDARFNSSHSTALNPIIFSSTFNKQNICVVMYTLYFAVYMDLKKVQYEIDLEGEGI